MKDSRLYIRLKKEFVDQIKEQARKENRTMSNLVETIIKEYLERSKK
jgi:predicted DNA-binding ribbon-helix-helix protein